MAKGTIFRPTPLAVRARPSIIAFRLTSRAGIIACPAGCSPPADGRQSGRRRTKWERLTRTISFLRTTLSSGIRYLLGSVAQSDQASPYASLLTRYSAESGTPSGRFIGRGLVAFGEAVGIEPGSHVSDEHLFRMPGMVQNRPLENSLADPRVRARRRRRSE